MFKDETPEHADQGVILEGVYFHAADARYDALVLTPRCDFENGKADFLAVCAIREAEPTVREMLQGGWHEVADENGQLPANVSAGQAKTIRKDLERLIQQTFPRLHWLPPYADRRSSLVDFQLMQSVDPDEADALVRIAALASPYSEQVNARYVAYFGRVGVNDPPGDAPAPRAHELFAGIFPGQE